MRKFTMSMLAALAVVLSGLVVAPAVADTVQNSLASAGGTSFTAGGSTDVSFQILNTNNQSDDYPDTLNRCNASDGTNATVTVNVPPEVTVSPSSRIYTGCDAAQSFTFSSDTADSYPITVSVADSGPGTYYPGPADFTLTVDPAPVVDEAPTVTVNGVDDDAPYEHGSVPVAGCHVEDDLDGTTDFPATLSAITGPRAEDGLGSQTANCSYTDAGDNTGTASATYTIVDTTLPVVEVTPPAALEATGPVTAVTFAVSANDSLDGPLTATCEDSGGTSYASGDGFPVGTTTLTCSATDIAGNTGTSDPFDVTVTDTTGPEITTSANLTESAVDADGAVVNYDAATATDLVDGAVVVTCLPASGSTFPLGETTVECDAEDSRENPSSESFTVTVQDDTVPVITVPADITEEATGPNGAAVEFTVSAEDNVDGAIDATCDYESGDTFPLGTTTVTCSAEDAATNTSQNSFTITVEDTTAPDLTLPDDITEEATSASGAEVTFTASADDLVDGDLTPTCIPASGETFPLGTTTVTCDVTDEAGNPSSDTFTVTVEDTTAPDVDVPGDITEEATGSDGAVVTYGAATAEDIVDGALTPSCAPASGATFPLGQTTVTCSVTDTAGNTGSDTFTVTVRDTTPPAVTVPANLVVGNTSPTGAAGVTYSGQSAVDLVDGAVDVNCTPASGGFFPLGETTVTCSAEDAAGNSDSKAFTVEVQDWTEPVVTVPADITAEATSAAGATVTWIGVTAEDDVSGSVDATCEKTSGSVFPLGTTEVTCSAEDAAGNIGENSFTVTVEDTTAPVVTTSGNLTAVATSTSGAAVSYTAPIAEDLVDGPVPASCDIPSGSTFPLGVTTVTCTATDEADNTGTATFTVTVSVSWSNVLQPINAGSSCGNGSVFKLGSTVPVKFRLSGASAGITNLTAKLGHQRLASDGTLGVVNEAISTSSATTGNLFRYDATAAQYIFNLNTKPLGAGCYRLLIDLGDGTPRSVDIGLR